MVDNSTFACEVLNQKKVEYPELNIDILQKDVRDLLQEHAYLNSINHEIYTSIIPLFEGWNMERNDGDITNPVSLATITYTKPFLVEPIVDKNWDLSNKTLFQFSACFIKVLSFCCGWWTEY